MSMLNMYFDDAERQSRQYIAMAKAATASSGNPYSGSGSLFQNSLSHHDEQLKHNKGYVYAIIRLIANRIAGQPVHIARKNDKTGKLVGRMHDYKSVPQCWRKSAESSSLVEDHPLLTTLAKPNPIMLQWNMMYFTISSLELTGKAYWWIRRTAEGGFEIWPMPVSWMTPRHTADKLFAGWTVRPTTGFGGSYDLSGEDVAYFYYPDPTNPLSALSPMQAMAATVFADEMIDEAQRRAFLNGTNPGLALVVGRLPGQGVGDDQPVLSKEQRETLINSVKRHYKGVVNNDEPLILDGLIKDAKKITSTPREMDFLDSGQVTKARLSNGWGVNPVSMGEMQSNRAESAVADDHLIANVIVPRIEMISQVITTWVIPRFTDDRDLMAWIEIPTSRDLDHELALETSMYDRGAMSINEWRARRGMPPVAGGNVAITSAGDVPVLPAGSPLPAQPINYDSDEEESEASFKSLVAAAESQHKQAIKNAMKDKVKEIGEFVVGQLNSMGANGAAINETSIELAFHENEWLKQIQDAVLPHMRSAAVAGAALEWRRHSRAHGTGEKGAFDIPIRIARRTIEIVHRAIGSPNWREWLGTVKNVIKRFTRIATEAGETVRPSEIVRMALSPTSQDVLTETAAEVETKSSFESGYQAAREHIASTGVVIKKRWVSALKSTTRPSHRQCHGQTVGINEKFVCGGFQCDFPMDPSLPPELRCNCYCKSETVYV